MPPHSRPVNQQPRCTNASPLRLQDAVAIDDLHLPQNVIDGNTRPASTPRAAKPRAGQRGIDRSLANKMRELPQSASKRNARQTIQRAPVADTSRMTSASGSTEEEPSVAQQAVDKLVLQLAQQQAEAARREATLQQLLQRSSQVNKEVALDNQRLRQHVTRLQQSNDQLQLEVIGLRTTLQARTREAAAARAAAERRLASATEEHKRVLSMLHRVPLHTMSQPSSYDSVAAHQHVSGTTQQHVSGTTQQHDSVAVMTTVVGSSADHSDCSTGTQQPAPTDHDADSSLRRSSRSRLSVDYALPSLRTKLRQGDRHTFGEAMRRRRPGRTKPARRVPVDPPVVQDPEAQ